MGGSLGISMNVASLLIEKVAPHGLIAEWNAAHPGNAVGKGDFIVDVNGQDDPETVITECKKAQELKFTFLRVKTVDAQKSARPRHVTTPENLRRPAPITEHLKAEAV